MPTFGPIENTIPPAVVCDIGAVSFPEGSATPIRFIHFESRRVVIDIAGPSSRIDVVFEQLQQILAMVAVPDGSAAMGTPAQHAHGRRQSQDHRPAPCMRRSRLCVIERPQQIILVLRDHSSVKQGRQSLLCLGRRDERIDFRRNTLEP
jgi:hypothetical protein